MAEQVRSFMVTWRGETGTYEAPSASIIRAALRNSYLGGWEAIDMLTPVTAVARDGNVCADFINQCLKHIPPGFEEREGAEATILRYLTSVADMLDLLSEHTGKRWRD